MARFGLVGGGYTAQAVSADCQKCMNFYPERNESGSGRSDWILLGTPGTKAFSSALTSPTRGGCEINGRMFAVGATEFCEISAAGAKTLMGTVANDGTLCSFAVGLTQVMIASAGKLYCFTLATNAFIEINTTNGSALQGSVAQVRFDDGYFLALLSNSSKFQLSALLDGTAWDPLDIAQISVFPGNVPAFLIDHREAVVFGKYATVFYADTGNPLFPFEVIPGAYVESGIAAALSAVKLDNSTFWIGGDERGQGMAWRFDGYRPARISTHAQENEWSTYSTIADAVGYAYQDQGHSFWCVYFPTAGKFWVYDTASGFWHERGRWTDGAFTAHRSWWHVFCFGKHLVGDWNTGTIYEMKIPTLVGATWTFCDDDGNALRRVRRAPYIGVERERVYFPELLVDVETGLGLVDGTGAAVEPQMMLSWSDDFGHSFRDPLSMGCGLVGEYQKRVRWLQLGQSRGRVFEISVTDAIPWRIVDAYVPPATERLATAMRKQA